MDRNDVDKLAIYVAKKYYLYGPVKRGKDLKVKAVTDVKTIDYSARITDNGFKNIFLPEREEIFYYQQNKVKKIKPEKDKGVAAWGMNVLDLKALGLLDIVFSDDPWYLNRRERNLVVGISAGAPANYADYQVFSMDKEENVLEHVPFDIFLQRDNDGEFHVYSGSVKGRKILKAAGIDVFHNIHFVGLIQEQGLDQQMQEMKKRIQDSESHEVWKEIGKICTACGKCSAICPTCFCFDTTDLDMKNKKVIKERSWGDCFRPDFSRIAGDVNYLKNNQTRIFFWYYHKFCRIPKQYQVPGCVSCMRCFKICPVGINITQVLNKLKKKNG